MMSHRPVLWMVCVALLTTSGLGAQERTAMRVSIGGASLPPDVQPRVIVEQQLGVVDQVRIQVMGSRGVGYADAIAPGDDVDIVAFRLDGGSIPIFSGHVVSLERGFDESQPFVVIRAASPLPRGESPSGKSVILTTRSDAGVKLVAFLPRLSAASSVQEVVVTGVDSSTGGQSIGRAVAPTILLGAGSDAPFGARLMIDTDRRFSSADEANAFAWSVLSELVATRISAEALTAGDPEIGIGSFVEVEGLDEEFDAPYYVAGVTHRFGPEAYSGYSSVFRLRRADFGMFRSPAIDDEVLVAFEHGDLNRPYVVGSFWDCDSKPPAERSTNRDPCRLLRWPW